MPLSALRSAESDWLVEMPAFDLAEQLRIDSLEATDLRNGFRFAYKFLTDYRPDNAGRWFTLPDGTVQHYEEDVNRRYEREIEYFADYAMGDAQQSCNPPALALDVLKLTLGEH